MGAACVAPSPRTVTFSYTDDLLTAVGVPGNGGAYSSAISYHPNLMVNQVSHANGLTDTYANDSNQMTRPASITVTTPTAAVRWATGTYGYDGAGNIKSIGAQTFTYDKVSRLTTANLYLEPTSFVTLRTQTYTFDAFGNLQSIGGNGARNTPTTPATNHLTAGTYGTSGNLTNWNGNAYEYDPFHLMWHYQTPSDEWVYLYTADDERVWSYKTDNTSLWTLRGLDAKVLREYTNNGTWTVAADSIYRSGLLLATETPQGTRHLHLDHLGTPRLISDAFGNQTAYHVYYPFGEEATAFNQDTLRAKLTGHERDLGNAGGAGDDLDYMHARHESPVTGRFLSVDPGLNVRGVMKSPQRWNRYTYAVNNPMKLVDPDGKEAIVFIAGPSDANDPKGVFGHAALYVTSKTGKAGISYGGARGFEKGIRGFIAFYTGEGRQVRMYVPKTTPEQDQKMVEFLKSRPSGNVNQNAPGADLMVTQNCTTAVCNTLQAGGVLKEGETANGAMTFLSKPSELQESLDTGELSDDVKAVVIFDPEADKKAQQTSTDLQSASCFFTGVCGVAPPPQ